VDVEKAVATVAARQHGLISFAQARSLGMSGHQIRHRMTLGIWERVRPTVYAFRGAPRSWPQTVLSAVLATAGPAYASHRTAARLWRLPIDPGDRIEITTMLERRLRIDGVCAHRSGAWDERDIASVSGIPTTSVARTLADLSSALTPTELGAALDHGLRKGVVSLSAMHAVARRFGIAPGRSPKTMLAVLAKRIPGYDPGDSELETHVWEVIRNAGLPIPVRRHSIRVNGRRYVIDLAYPEQKIAIEVDGFDVHAPRTPFDGDRARQNVIVLAHWKPLRYTSASPDHQIVSEVTAALFGHSPPPRVTE
jgi:very-short-patch-repair endonuclease